MIRFSFGDLSAPVVLISFALACMCLNSPQAAAAETYFGVGGGISYAPNVRLEGSDIEIDYDVGFFTGSLTYGRYLDSGWLLEVEGSFRRNELEIAQIEQDPGFIITDKLDAMHALSLMVNSAYRFDLELPVTPYVGAGVGISAMALEISDEYGPGDVLNDDAVVMSYQFYAGLLVPIGRRWQIAADYRWWQTLDFDMETGAAEPVSLNYSTRALSVSFRRLLNGAVNPKLTQLPAETSGFYVDARLGTAIAADSDIVNRFDTNFDAFDLGVVGALALGYSHVRPSGRRLRGELEIHGWANEADVIDFGIFVDEVPLTGDVEVRGAAFNVVYDFLPSWALNPYAGLGIGYTEVDYDISLRTSTGVEPFVQDSYSGMSAQALLGFGIRLTERTELSVNYRYWLTPSVELEDPAGAPIETEHATHLLMLGLRYGF